MADSTSAIDLSQLPAPTVVEQMSYEDIRAAAVAKLVEDLPTFDATVTSDPAVKVLEVYAYREMLLRQQFNERARQVMLAYATGSNLDQLGALLNVERLSGEEDDAYKARIQLAPEAFSVAGPASAYRYYALSAASTVADASVTSPKPDDIRAAVLALLADQGADAGLVAAMTALLDDAVWPGTVLVSLLSARGWLGQRGRDRGGGTGDCRRRGRAARHRLAAGALGRDRRLRDRYRSDAVFRA
jgi:phage-related baseplate assembly protein